MSSPLVYIVQLPVENTQQLNTSQIRKSLSKRIGVKEKKFKDVKRTFGTEVYQSFRNVKDCMEAVELYTYMKTINEAPDNRDLIIVEPFIPVDSLNFNIQNVVWINSKNRHVLGCYISSETVTELKHEFLLEETLEKHLSKFLQTVDIISPIQVIRKQIPFENDYKELVQQKRIKRVENIKKNGAKVCLCMIVKNEGKIITRAFDSISRDLDYWVIADTGSTDNTKNIIKDYFKSKNIPGLLLDHKWKNFGHNRTLVVQEACRLLYAKGYYLLLMDADFEMKVNDSDWKKKLNPVIDDHVLQYQGDTDYYRSLIISADFPWFYKHGTHEYLSCHDSPHSTKFYSLTIFEHPDGGCKSDKFERDVKILLEEIEETKKKGEKPESRCMFYLGQSYECLGKWDESIKYYESIKEYNNPWDEEVYIGLTRAGDNRMKRGEPFEAVVGYWMKAHAYRPHRLDALGRILSYCQAHRRYNEGYYYGINYKHTYKGYPQDLLFINRTIHNFEFWDNMSICSFYAGDYKESIICLNRLYSNHGNLMKDISQSSHTRLLGNGKFSADKLIHSSITQSPIALTKFNGYPITLNIIPDKFNGSSPSIVINKNKYGGIDSEYLMNIRLVNYTINEQQEWKYKYEGNIQTKNMMCWVNKQNDQFTIVHSTLVEDGKFVFKYSCGIDGLEDIRLFWKGDRLHYTATSLQVREDNQKCMVCGWFNTLENGRIELGHYDVLDGYLGNQSQKNWTVFEDENNDKDVKFIHSFCPYTITNYNIESEEQYVNSIRYDVCNQWRGSTQAIKYKDSYLTIVHTSNFPRYSHTFVELDDNGIKRWSAPFYFHKYEIEFTCGMCISVDGQELIIGYSRCDNHSSIATIKLKNVEEMLVYKRTDAIVV